MTKMKRNIAILAGIIVLASVGAIFWRSRPRDNIVINPNITDERRGQVETELTAALDALARDPKNVDNLLTVGRLKRILGRLSEAEDYYRQVLKISADDYRVYADLGTLYGDMGNYGQADKMLRIATELNPNDARIFEQLIDLYFAHFPDKADELKNIFRAASDYAKNPYIWTRYAKFLEDRREYREALLYYQEALAQQPDDQALQASVERVARRIGGLEAK